MRKASCGWWSMPAVLDATAHCACASAACASCRDGGLCTRQLALLSRAVPGAARAERRPRLLPVTEKKRLMARFDDWVTDRDVRIGSVRKLIEDPGLIGTRFLGKYTVATTSGTIGTPGIFLPDDRTLSVTNALALRMLGGWLSCGDVIRIIVGGGRTVTVIANGGHFACGRRCTPSLRACFPRTSLPTSQSIAPRNCQSSPQVASTAPSFH